MPNVWDADVDVTVETARRLVESQFPQFSGADISLLGAGFDNVAFLIGDAVFRLPRRKMGADLLAREVRCLPLLSPLPQPIPRPEWLGVPDLGYPYPFAGYPWIAGDTACSVGWTDAERRLNAALLGAFLAALHSVPADEGVRAWAPTDDLQRASMAKRVPMALDRLERVRPIIGPAMARSVSEEIGRLSATPEFRGIGCWVHGDLYARHLLVDGDRRLCGVIDWGDVHLGDPALDLSIAFSYLPESARGDFRAAYGPIEEAAWDRARFRALWYGVVLIEYGESVNDRQIAQAGRDALRYGTREG